MLRRLFGLRIPVILASGYWLLLFSATHIPRSAVPAMHASDKLIHAGAFLWLSAFLCWAIPKRWIQLPVEIWAGSIAIAYAGFDELTQIPVGRTADWNDWFADVAGTLLGLVCYRVARTLYVRWRRRQALSPA